ncbi:MAG: response regulator [Chitinophagaceae bacterium]|nr:MAG: response regulator [Chitinophagaceae bacterium]
MTVNKYIIYVEDDPDDVLLLQEAFREVPGYELVVLEHGAALLHFLERTLCFPDLIILDINMPVLNGHETLRALKQHPLYQQIPVVLFSTGSNPGELLFAAAYNTDLIVKPYDYASLRQSVRRLLAYAVGA